MLKVSCAIIEKEDRTLIALRSETMTNPNKWEFPGGKLDNGETPWNALKREIKEELNLSIEMIHQLEEHIYSYPNFTICLYPFVCSAAGDMILLEHSKAEYLDLKTIETITLSNADIGVLEMYKKWKGL